MQIADSRVIELYRLKRPDKIPISLNKRQIERVKTKLEEQAKPVRLKVSTEEDKCDEDHCKIPRQDRSQ